MIGSSSTCPLGDNSTEVTTAYSYEFYFDSVQVYTSTTVLPQIPASQNGQGVGDSYPIYNIQQTFDIEGRLTDQTDPYNANPTPPVWIPSVQNVYDEPTGAIIQSVRNPYIDGTPPDNVQYNLTTDYTVDSLGRTIETLGPWFNSNGQQVRTAAWAVYRDIEHEMWSGSGYVTGTSAGEYTYTLVNPVSIAKMDFDGRTIEQITAIRPPNVAGTLRVPFAFFPAPPCLPPLAPGPSYPSPFLESSGRLSAGDFFPQSSYVRWSTTHYGDAGDMTLRARFTSRSPPSVPASPAATTTRRATATTS